VAPTAPRLAPGDPRLAGRHLLTLPVDVDPEEVEVLALSRFAGVRWETPVPGAPPRGRAAREPLAGVGVLRLSRHSSLAGPFAVADDDAARLGLPADTATAFVVLAPRERGEPPYPGGDRDGLKRAFRHGLPVRDEERVLRWLVDAARRLGGALRVGDDDGGVVLVPDPGAAVDLTVWSTGRLAPDAGLAVVRDVAPAARLAMDAAAWSGPAATPVRTGLGERTRRRVHERADAADAAALAGPDELTGYGIEVDLGPDGLVVVEAGAEDEVPFALRGLAWAAGGVATYRVRWEPPDVEDLEREHATPAHRASRERASGVVGGLARALHAAVGGAVTDAAEFGLDPADL
jgi:hypothetical protein